MRNLADLAHLRRTEWELRAHGVMGDRGNGCFELIDNGVQLTVVASNGGGWDHLSVSTPYRCPTWGEMETVRKTFSAAAEVWVQFGVPEQLHINIHPYCLHWWRHQHRELRLPPSFMVGPSQENAHDNSRTVTR